MEKSKHLQDQLKELKTEIESLKLEEQQQQAGLYNLRGDMRGYVQEPVYIPHSNVCRSTSYGLFLVVLLLSMFFTNGHPALVSRILIAAT